MTHPRDFDEALCVEKNPELFFIDGKGSYPREALNTCNRCKHQTDCAEYAIPFYNLDGLWGGLSPGQRATIRKQRGIPGRSIQTLALPLLKVARND